MAFFDRNFLEIVSAETVSLFGGLVAGIALALYTDQLLIILGMLILLPGFLELRGNISGAFASRLSSGLFLGVIDPRRFHTRLVLQNLAASFFLAIVVSLSLGAIAFLFSFFVFHIVSYKLLLLPVVAGVLANAIEIPLTLFVTFYLFRKGHDPNNIMGPFVSSTGDIVSILALLAALVIL
jgi:mgtE-like transporter